MCQFPREEILHNREILGFNRHNSPKLYTCIRKGLQPEKMRLYNEKTVSGNATIPGLKGITACFKFLIFHRKATYSLKSKQI